MPKIIAAGVGLPLIGTGATVTTSQPLLDLTQTWNNAATAFTGLKLNVTDTASASGSLLMDLQVGGSGKFNVDKVGSVFSQGTLYAQGGSIRVLNNAGVLSLGTNNDVILARDAANTLALRNGTAAQAFNVYNTYTDASNHERGGLVWSGNDFYLATNNVGTGVARSLIFATNNLPRWRVEGSTGHFLANTDNTYDIGASGASRPRNIWVGTQITAGGGYAVAGAGYYGWSGRTILYSPADAVTRLANNAGTITTDITLSGASSTGTSRATFGGGLTLNGNLIMSGSDITGTGSLQTNAGGFVRTTATTVSGLIAAATAGAGARSFVTDATATTFLSTVAGGGANKVPVVSDGTNWLIG